MKVNLDLPKGYDNKKLAIDIKNMLVAKNRCIGAVAEGLKQTLKKLEAERDSVEVGPTTWALKDYDLEENIAKVKAGIEGEQQLADYLGKLLKYNNSLDGIVAFASLSFEQNSDRGYIPDSDFLLVYGDNILIVDAKNISTSLKTELSITPEGLIINSKGKTILEVNPSTHIWSKALDDRGIKYSSIDGYVCIVNKTGANIIRDLVWEKSNTKPIHIVELEAELLEWKRKCDIKGENIANLYMLTEIASAQIKPKAAGLDLECMKKRFKV